MSSERFHYRGPAKIADIEFSNVELQENPPEGGQRSWEGEAFLSLDAATPATHDALNSLGPLKVELPDGRRAEAYLEPLETVVHGDCGWTFSLTGVGAAPA